MPATQEAEIEGALSEAGPNKKHETLSEQQPKAKRAKGVAQGKG
jgi:hypothetical protein